MFDQGFRVRKAIIPAAGLGTRFLPATRVVPKPLLPVLSRPLIHYSVAEAAAAGIQEIALVVSPGHEAIARYFEAQPKLERALQERGNAAELGRQRAITDLANVSVIIQEEALGLGHAVHVARAFAGDAPFAVLLPDDIFWAGTPVIGQLVQVHAERGGMVLAAELVPDERVPSLGIIDGEPVAEHVYEVRGLVEKPAMDEAPSNLAILGRYILTPEVFEHLAKARAGAGGEIQLTDAISAALGTIPVHAREVAADHADAGTPPGMLGAALREARDDPALRALIERSVAGWRQAAPPTAPDSPPGHRTEIERRR